jgi:hypothetical protein
VLWLKIRTLWLPDLSAPQEDSSSCSKEQTSQGHKTNTELSFLKIK